jgi:hypothetical protein
MSYQELEYQGLTEERVMSLIEEKLAKKTKTTLWWKPKENAYYRTNNPDPYRPHYDEFIANASDFRTGFNALKGASAQNLSSTEIDRNRFKGLRNEIVDQANRFWSDVDKAKEMNREGKELGAGVITTQDYPDIANIIIDATSYEKLARDFILQEAVTRKRWNYLDYTADDTTPYLNEPDMGENDVMEPRSIDYDRVTLKLIKAQGHVKASKWADLAIRDHNIVQDNFSIIDADFPRIFATNIAVTLAGFANNAAAGAYDVIGASAFHSTTNPMTEFRVDSASIRTAGGMGNTMAMNSTTFQVLTQNTFIRPGTSILGAVPPFENTASRKATHPMFPGYTIYIDELLTTGDIFVYDKRGVEFLEGPSRTATLNDDYNYFVSQIHDRWYNSFLRLSGFGSQQTGTVT